MPPDYQLEKPATARKAPLGLLLVFCSIWSGLIITENISGNVLPQTIEKFTTNAGIIGMILAVNPLFGFIAQPIVGILSDRIWTPLGRRAFFIITGAPVVALCLVFVPLVEDFWLLILLVVLYQFFQDILWGSDHPLMADLIPPEQRTLLQGMMQTSGQIASWIFLKFGFPHLDLTGLYWVAAGMQVIFVGGAAFFLNEKPVQLKEEHKKLTPKKYVMDVLGNTALRRFAFLSFFHMLFNHIIQGFIVLFALNVIIISKGEFGEAWSINSLIALVMAIPASILIEKFLPKQWALIGGYLMMMLACVLGLLADEAGDLVVIAVVWGSGLVVVNLTLKPFTTEYIPSDIIGQVSGAINIFLAVGRTVALAGGGWVIYFLGNNYRMIWVLGLIFGSVAVGICLSLPDLRFQSRKAEALKAKIKTTGESLTDKEGTQE